MNRKMVPRRGLALVLYLRDIAIYCDLIFLRVPTGDPSYELLEWFEAL